MGNAVKEIYYGIDNGVIQMLFDCRLQLACLGITVYITWEYISSRHLKTDFRKIYISMLLTADVYYIFDMLTYYMVNHMADYELWKVDLVHRFFYAAMDFLIFETFCYAAVLLKDVRKTGTGARYLMALPSVLCLRVLSFCRSDMTRVSTHSIQKALQLWRLQPVPDFT